MYECQSVECAFTGKYGACYVGMLCLLLMLRSVVMLCLVVVCIGLLWWSVPVCVDSDQLYFYVVYVFWDV